MKQPKERVELSKRHHSLEFIGPAYRTTDSLEGRKLGIHRTDSFRQTLVIEHGQLAGYSTKGTNNVRGIHLSNYIETIELVVHGIHTEKG